MATDIADLFLNESRRLLVDDYLPKIEQCVERLAEADIWDRPNEASNSIGNLLLHLHGNVTQWIVSGIGGVQFERRRQQEFDRRTPIARRELVARLRSAVERAVEVLGAVKPDALLERRRIQGYDLTVLEATYHVVEHFSMHTGQIILLTKARTGVDLKLWQPPAARDR
jgi:uncharacterized damage-inducible protein DinB